MASSSHYVVTIDSRAATVSVATEDGVETHPMRSAEAFAVASKAWLRCGWDVKHLYSFSWLGRPMLQLPEDMIRFQELVWQLQPDVILETGVAHGGSLVFSASLCTLMGRGRVIGVEKGLYPENKKALAQHPLADRYEILEGSSTDPELVAAVKERVRPGESVLAVFDSNHTKAHVLGELEAYKDLIPVGSYMLACDGIMKDLVDAPGSNDDWSENNPTEAARDFVKRNPDFEITLPPFLFNESLVKEPVTYWPDGIIRRRR